MKGEAVWNTTEQPETASSKLPSFSKSASNCKRRKQENKVNVFLFATRSTSTINTATAIQTYSYDDRSSTKSVVDPKGRGSK